VTKTCLWQVTPTKADKKRYKPAYEDQLEQQQLQEKELQLQREAEQGEKFYKNQLRLNSFMYVRYGLCIAWSVLWVLWHPPHHH